MENNKVWMRRALQLAAAYNVVWGSWVVLRPEDLFLITDIPLPRYLSIWQCVGMIVGVYGVGYALASRDPIRHWPITLVGFLGKIFGPVGFLFGLLSLAPGDNGYLPPSWGLTIITNDLIWWIPFGMILYAAVKASSLPKEQGGQDDVSLSEMLDAYHDQHGNSLNTLSRDQPLMLLFLRHSGCTFCREALSDVSNVRDQLEERTGIAVVHMGTEEEMSDHFLNYGLENVSRVCDPSCRLFRRFGLTRGSFGQLFGVSIWSRGAKACLIDGHGVGKLAGDGFQMPGLFLIEKSKIIKAYRHKNAADRPDYLTFVRDSLKPASS